MKFFAIYTSTEYEYKLYDIHSGIVFFILKDKSLENWEGPDYYTAQLFDYDPIAEELKEWLIQVIKNNPKIFLEDYLISVCEVFLSICKLTPVQVAYSGILPFITSCIENALLY